MGNCQWTIELNVYNEKGEKVDTIKAKCWRDVEHYSEHEFSIIPGIFTKELTESFGEFVVGEDGYVSYSG